ncbi:MAG: L,D-transpeptidase family protein [Myxococcota bacterium]
MRATFFVVLLLSFAAVGEDRVAEARQAKGQVIKDLFRAANLVYPPDELYVRAFKHEKELEVWAGKKGQPLSKVKSYSFCSASGELGPKRRLGDLQVPEGFYVVDRFNRRSNFLLSLGVSYPNDSDRLLGEKGWLGGDIFIHGSCVSIGCIAIEDGPIQEVFVMALDTRQRRIPVHIFPRRLDAAGFEELARHPRANEHLQFWKGLQPGYLYFEEKHRPPRMTVDPKTGAYRIHKG